jgi:quercetin dioxygenase-like cupin family protein
MKASSLIKNIEYNEDKPSVNVLFETENTKEIRIVFRKGQAMKNHQTPFPIIVEIFDGEIDFDVRGDTHRLQKGDLVALEGNVQHNLSAKADSIVRLTLSKQDKAKRVKDVVDG